MTEAIGLSDSEDRDATVEVRGRWSLDATLGVVALGVGAAFWVRSGSWVDGVVGAVLMVLAAFHIGAALSARAPVLVADPHGIRIRIGGAWRGIPWAAIRQVVVERRGSVLAEDRLVVVPRESEALADLGPQNRFLGRAHLRWNRLWYDAALSLPVGLTAESGSEDLVADLRALAGPTTEIVRLRGPQRARLEEPSHARPEPSEAGPGSDVAPGAVSGPLQGAAASPRSGETPDPRSGPKAASGSESAAVAAYDPVPAVRAVRRPMRAEVRIVSADPAGGLPEQRSPERDEIDVPSALPPAPVADPVIGPRLVSARERLGLSVDDLSERTRIRPHLIEAMEGDDFDPCGGDFYARGHLGALARTLGLDADALIADYDERYAHGPINARRVFEAELATGLAGGGLGGGLRATGGGPRWTLLVASVLSLAVIWGLAHLLGDSPEQLVAPPEAAETAGLAGNQQPITSPKMTTTKMTVTAAHAPAHVVVRDRTGKILWSGDLRIGEDRQVAGLAPFKVEADNAGAVEVTVRGTPRGPVGAVGEPGSKRFPR